MSAGDRRLRLRNELEFRVLTSAGPLWRLVQRVDPLARVANRVVVNSGVNKLPPRPYQLTTMHPYPSWDSLTDKSYNARQLPPATDGKQLPPAAEVAALFLRNEDEEEILCPKSTVLFAYFAQWFTDGFLRTPRDGIPAPGGEKLGGKALRLRDVTRNESTHEVDLLQLYGPTPGIAHLLRAHEDGLLSSWHDDNGEEFPPLLCEDDGTRKPEFANLPFFSFGRVPEPRRPQLLALGSDIGNSQIGYAMLTVLFLREHNRIARRLAAEYERPSGQSAEDRDEWLFAKARSILTVLLIKLAIEEYINHITPYHFNFRCRPRSFDRARWHKPNWVAVEFNLLYRWHSLLPSALDVDGEKLPLESTTFNNETLLRRGLGPLFDEASRQRAGRIGLYNTTRWLHDHTELQSILEARNVGLAPYNDYREACRFPRARKFTDVTSDQETRTALESVYGDVDDIEFYVGLFAEDLRPNSVLPPLLGRMVGVHAFSQLMTNPLLSPAIFTPETFTPLGWQMIHADDSIERLLNRNVPGSKSFSARLTWAGWRRS